MGTNPENGRVIHRIRAVQLGGLRDIDIRPPAGPALVIINGPNSSGKTSLMNVAKMVMGGARSAPRKAIHKDFHEALGQVDLGDILVTATWREGENGKEIRELTVERKDGEPLGDTPQSFLDSIAPDSSFDPMWFLTLRPEQQAEEFRKILGIDISDLIADRKRLYDHRTLLNRDLKKAETLLKELPNPPGPDTLVSVGELSQRLQEALKHNSDRSSMLDEQARVAREIADLEAKLTALRERQRLIDEAVAQSVPVDVEPLQRAIRDAEKTNEIVRQRQKYQEAWRETIALRSKVAKVQEEMDSIDAQRRAVYESIEPPVPGLTLEDGFVAYHEIPLEQCADNEKVRVAAEIQLARHPNFRAIFLRGNELDEDKFPIYEALAKEKNAQIWIEYRGKVENPTFVLFDGELAK